MNGEEAFKRGEEFYERAEYSKAIECYKKAIEEDSTFASAYAQLGVIYHNMGNVQQAGARDALGILGKVIAANVHEAVGWFHGSTYMRRWNRFREQSGDMLLHKGCHTLDLFNWITGIAEIEKFNSLHHPPLSNVKTWNDTFG